MADDRSLQSALDVKHLEQLPEVEPYYDKVYQRTYSNRWSGYVAGFLMAGVVGAGIGAVAAFLPFMLGAGSVPAWPAIGQSMAIFAGAGTTVGFAICTAVGAAAGAISAGFEEHERREKLEKIRAKNPELAEKIERAITAKAEAARPKTMIGQWLELAKRSFDWKQVALGAVIGMGTGAMFAVNPTVSAWVGGMDAIIPFAKEYTMAMGAGLGALIGGAFFGFQGGIVSNAFANVFRPVLNSKIFEGKDKTPQYSQDIAEPAPSLQAASEPAKDGNYFRKTVMESRLVNLETQTPTRLH